MDDRTKLSVWEKATKIRGKDADIYRKDINGYEMYWHSFGKNTDMGWIIKNTGRKTVNFNLEDFNAVSYSHQDEKPDKKDTDKKGSDKKETDKKGSDKKETDKKETDKKGSDKKGSDKKGSDKTKTKSK